MIYRIAVDKSNRVVMFSLLGYMDASSYGSLIWSTDTIAHFYSWVGKHVYCQGNGGGVGEILVFKSIYWFWKYRGSEL